MKDPVAKIVNVIPLWPGQKSSANIDKEAVDDSGRIRSVSAPRLVPYLPTPEKSNGLALLVCPGGGYRHLAWTTHVERLAERFNPLGIAVIGLAYRTAPPSDNVPADAVADLCGALDIVGANAGEWKIDPDRLVGVGFSAGANLLLHYACADDSYCKQGEQSRGETKLSHMALLCLWPYNKSPDDYAIRPDAPSTLLCATEEDETAPAEFSQAITRKLQGIGGDAQVKVYPTGNHLAFNFKESGPEVDWTPDFLAWLKVKGLFK